MDEPSTPKLKLKMRPPTRATTDDSDSDAELLPDGLIDNEDIQLMHCEWDGCPEVFWLVESLVDHITIGECPSKALFALRSGQSTSTRCPRVN
jgi:hypothetical protein